jgi:TolA-binding protein
MVGECRLLNQNYAQAEEAYTHAVRDFPANEATPRAFFKLGWTQFKQGKYQQAIASFRLVLEKFPNAHFAPEAQFLIGQSFVSEKNDQQAVAEFLTIATLYPQEIEWMVKGILEAAKANERLGRATEARQLYLSIIEKYPAMAESVQIAKDRLSVLARP